MGEIINLDAVTAGLRSIAILRNGVDDLFKSLTEGTGGPLIDPTTGQPKSHQKSADPSEETEKQFLSGIQESIDSISTKLRELETYCDLLAHQSASINLSMLGTLAQDPAFEKSSLYPTIVSSYRWFDRLHDYVTQSSHLLNQHIFKRNIQAMDPLQRWKIPQGIDRRPSFTGINTPSSQIDAFFNNLARMLPNLSIEISRPFGAPTLLSITLDKILKANVLLHGLLIEWVIVKSFTEDFKSEDGSIDIWSESRYEIFRKVTEHCNSAMLHFATPVHVELAVRSWLNWLVSYNTLFTKPCRACGQRLSGVSLPTWRDFRSGDAFHEKCRP